MKKQFIIYLLSFIIMQAFTAGAVKKIEVNPINIAVALTQEIDTVKIKSTLDYYGYQRSLTPDTSTPDTYVTFTHPNGSMIRYKLSDQKYPIIEVNTKCSQKEKEQILRSLNFQNRDKVYERRAVGTLTRCVVGEQGSLVFSTIKVERN